MSKVTITMFPAKKGDCFLISLGEKNQKHILIDSGYPDTYNRYLKTALENISGRKECIDLFIITHIDEDHIAGAISFLKDNNENNMIEINEIWHNSYKHLQFDKEKTKSIPDKERKILEANILSDSLTIRKTMKDANATNQISANQGSCFAALIYEGKYAWNTSFGGKSVNCDILKNIDRDGYRIRLLSPDSKKLNELSATWLKDLRKRNIFHISDEAIFDDAFEFSMLNKRETFVEVRKISSSFSTADAELVRRMVQEDENDLDTDEANGSSIAFILEYGTKKLLFLGDAHADLVTQSLNEIGETSQIDCEQFHVIKLPHHGSKRNMNNALAGLLKAERYLISTNGRGPHKHPDFEALARIFYAQRNTQKQFIFNYKDAVPKEIGSDDLKNFYQYSIETGDEKDGVEKPTIIRIGE